MSRKRLKFAGLSPLNLGASLARGAGIDFVDMFLRGIRGFGVDVVRGVEIDEVGKGICEDSGTFKIGDSSID